MTLAIGLFLMLAALAWAAVLVHLGRGVRHFESLRVDDGPIEPPCISVVCGVKDEERLIGDTVRGLLAVGAPILEVIVVDDRSTDRTPEILAEIAREHPELKVVRIDALPDGWQGRAHAQHRGAQAARGELILSTDAEIELDPEILSAVVRLVRERQLDHLAVLPEVYDKPYLLDLLLTTAMVFYLASYKPWLDVSERPLSAVRGVGVFNLVRRATLEASPGFPSFRMEIIDDVALAQCIARHGGRSQLVRATARGPRFHWYRTVREMTVRLEKTIVGAFADYRLGRAVGVTALSLSCVLIPLLALCALPSPLAAAALGVFATATVLFAALAARPLRRRVAVLIALPLGIALMGSILLRASLLCHLRGGILWKDALYPIDDLRAHRRTAFRL